MSEEFVLVGIDGGSTLVKAHNVVAEDGEDGITFRLGEHSAVQRYRRIIGFEPPDMQEQLAEYYSGNIQRAGFEVVQAECYVEAIVSTIRAVAEAAGASAVLVGMGFPGLKTADGRGVAAANNMPRAPRLLDDTEESLRKAGVKLYRPIARLGSNADYCGVGEEYAAEGSFREVENAYYAGCGTGIADALKLQGELMPFDSVGDWIKKSWQLRSSFGENYERVASAAALTRRYANAVHLTPEEVTACGRFPELAAVHGDEIAVHLLTKAGAALAELMIDRILTIRKRYDGLLLDRLVVGQRLGAIYGKDRYRDVFRDKLDKSFVERLSDMGDEQIQSFYLEDDGTLRDGVVVASRIRAASALGAAIDAYRHFMSESS